MFYNPLFFWQHTISATTENKFATSAHAEFMKMIALALLSQQKPVKFRLVEKFQEM